MNKLRILTSFLFYVLMLFVHHYATAQTCGTKEVNEKFLLQHPEYRSQAQALKQEITDRINNPASAQRGLIVNIPVVVHVIHLGEAVGNGSNISTTQIQQAITHLNQRFNNTIGNGVDLGIQFCLATQDPNGNPTTGINRVNGSAVANFSAQGIEWDGSGGASETDVKLLSIWPRADYYNIWVVHSIFGAVAGYAYYPTTFALEGAVVEAAYMTNTSTVLTHEMGHAFDLAHTFEGDDDGSVCPANTNCATQGDLICDTPPHRRSDCGSSNPCTSSGIFNNSRFNYMSYCGSTDRFTSNQKTRVDAAVASSARSTLAESTGCAASTCVTACNDGNPCTYDLCNNGVCSYPSINCNDNDACTQDVCTNFDCFFLAVDCADEDECTLDFCSGGCINSPLDCSDGDPCTADNCDEGQCFSNPVPCDDADPCTEDDCTPQSLGITIDYDVADEIATLAAGGVYERLLWQLNTRYTETNPAHTNKLEWAATRFNWLHDANTQQQYLYSENKVRIDSVDLTFVHRIVAPGTTDTIVITIYEDEGGIIVDNQDNILNEVLHVDTIKTNTSLSPDASTPVSLRLKPGLQLSQGQQFIVAVHFYGNLSNIFSMVAGYGDRCNGSCAAYSLYEQDNSWWKIIYWVNGTSNISGINNLYFPCNGNGVKDRANCELFYIQNFATTAYVTLLSLDDYECVYSPAACSVSISGTIRTEANVPVPGVTVTLSGSASGSVVTGSDGLYNFTVSQGGNYTVTPSKSNDVTTNNGVTTLDITLIRRHILGSTLLDSPYKIIAADGNNNSSTTTLDISLVRTVILNSSTKFPGNRLWEFVSSSQSFSGPPYNPFPFTKVRSYTNLTNSVVNQDFIGVKLGDVNNNWNPATP